ncbi:GIY-YIG nuclease family protein [Algicola sagamiensis]|uniref:GIY-YIG nuclease family protein n=1 Tax=Algicola sagamiensis TaxID=163869 RepID=UPI00036B97F7|nr:GIY-YIG nuclease family protein [Algicola sagamiensis]
MSSVWSVYLIRDKHHCLYCGISNDVQKRFLQHQQGKGAKSLRGKMPLDLVFFEAVGTRSEASQLEAKIKKLRKSQKEQLIIEGLKAID